jgi:hypothetical protein
MNGLFKALAYASRAHTLSLKTMTCNMNNRTWNLHVGFGTHARWLVAQKYSDCDRTEG